MSLHTLAQCRYQPQWQGEGTAHLWTGSHVLDSLLDILQPKVCVSLSLNLTIPAVLNCPCSTDSFSFLRHVKWHVSATWWQTEEVTTA